MVYNSKQIQRKTIKLGLIILISLLLYPIYPVTATDQPNSSSTTDQQDEQNSESDQENDEEEQAREQEIKKKKQQLREAESKRNRYQSRSTYFGAKADTLEKMIQNIDSQINQTQTSFNQTQKGIEDLEKKIKQKSTQINELEKVLSSKRIILSEYIKIFNVNTSKSTLEIMLASSNLSEYFQELNSLNQISNDIKKIYDQIKEDKNVILTQRVDLEKQMDKQIGLKIMLEQQRLTLETQKTQKNQLLERTQGEEEKYQALLQSEESIISRISAELTALQSHGVVIDFEDAVAAARYASNKTGVRVAYLLGILKVESNMGNNVGGGSYLVDMKPSQREIFEEICQDLDYDPVTMPVSKKPCYRDDKGNCTGWGGAMGPAQFIPSTWMGYKKQVEAVTGSKAANPWDIRHALTAMALKVTKIPGVEDHDPDAEAKAANIYLAGGNWENYTWYGDRVMKYADAFEQELNISEE
ncbi:MAG: hypothetical protein GF332_04035 [Candidatus Moranbacteria bacterium]|nr:hypothetical protein [Candidatus Moranbacteria bacterium]